MAEQGTFDPYDTFKKFSDQWEKQMNDLIHLWTNNREFVQFSGLSSDIQARYLEMFQKNQELLANQLNLPTKNDVANVAKLSVQTEEKLDSLEEQIWKLQDLVDASNKEIDGIAEVSRDIIKLTKQLKQEHTRTKKELAETRELRLELKEVKSQLADIHSLKDEIANLKELMLGSLVSQAEQEPEQNQEQGRELAVAHSK